MNELYQGDHGQKDNTGSAGVGVMNENKIILDLCGGTGAWSKPYKDAGYDARITNALYEHDKGRYLPVSMSTCEEYGLKGLCGKGCPNYGGKEECNDADAF
jgi:hypothetical protein